jgi:hypothetical protein
MAFLATLFLNARKNGYSPDHVARTRWVNGYLLGLPQPFDEVSQALGGGIRKALFHSLHNEQTADQFVRKALSYLDLEDEQTQHGFGAGVPDGQRCFAAIESGGSFEGVFLSLESFFEMKSIDERQTIKVE